MARMDDDLDPFGPGFDPRPQYGQVRAALLTLLGRLTPDEWDRPTAAAPWTVRDVVAHLLGDDLSRLSRSRDGYSAPGRAAAESLPEFLHRFNAEWVQAAARVSPGVLIDLLQTSTELVSTFWKQADLTAFGEPVSWAGPGPAPAWLDCARDLTEDWLHQQQIREATGKAVAPTAPVLFAVLDTFLRAMPYTLGQHEPDGAAEGSTLVLQVPGAGGGRWAWRRGVDHWGWAGPADRPTGSAETASIDIQADTLWRLCARMIEPEQAAAAAELGGDQALGRAALQLVAIIR
jgi:uncharacterized protein (TIGR03083 family)